jgi:hypothetical protein
VRFRKKPLVIEAKLSTGVNINEMREFATDGFPWTTSSMRTEPSVVRILTTSETTRGLSLGLLDWPPSN